MASRRLGFVITHADDEPELATIPFMIATAALTMDAEPVLILQAEGVRLGVKGCAEACKAEGMPELEGLLAGIIEAGCAVMVCSACMDKRGIAEDELRDGVFIGGAAKVVEAMLECDNMLTY